MVGGKGGVFPSSVSTSVKLESEAVANKTNPGS